MTSADPNCTIHTMGNINESRQISADHHVQRQQQHPRDGNVSDSGIAGRQDTRLPLQRSMALTDVLTLIMVPSSSLQIEPTGCGSNAPDISPKYTELRGIIENALADVEEDEDESMDEADLDLWRPVDINSDSRQ